MSSPSTTKTRARLLAASVGCALAAVSGAILPSVSTAAAAAPAPPRGTLIRSAGTGLAQGAVKHVWLIILENKSYDATFTGLNNNSYLWKTLPGQGVELKNYYGTGHSSQDNYLSLVSGQAPEEDVQSDCSVQNYNLGSNATTVNTAGSPNLGQTASSAGANANNGLNGCTFPAAAPTLFNQLDAAGKTWKGYAQDLGGASANSPTAVPNGTSTLDLRPGDGANTQTPTAANGQTATNTQDRDASACGGSGSSTNFAGAQNTGTPSTTGSTSTNNPTAYGVTTFTSAQPDDQYVAKHFPFPWFHAVTGTTGAGGSGITTPTENGAVTGYDCDSAHIANLDDPTNGLEHDLTSAATTPAFSWITPDNCSDAHDAVCKGNNLSGAFDTAGNPVYNTTPQTYDPESTTPTNYTGGLYASDLFLRYYIPLIERSAAFKDGGLIDVTFDEADPPFTYSNSFNNQPAPGAAVSPTAQGDTTQPANCLSPTGNNTVVQPCTPTVGAAGTYAPGANSVYGGYGIESDAAGENINGQNVNSEPTGVNSTLATDASGNQLDPGPGNNAHIDRPATCVNTSPSATCVLGGGNHSPALRTDTVSGGSSSSIITDPSIQADDTGRIVTDTTDGTIPANTFVGTVTNSGPVVVATNGATAYTGSFQLVDANGNPVTPRGPVTKLSLSAEAAPGAVTAGQTTDPLYDATDATPGGGDTGSILISPYITPGTSTTTYYNHYSWLRTMEDLFAVSSSPSSTNNPVFLTDTNGASYRVAGGLDGLGHLGFAAQPGLAAFGADVFNNPSATAAPTPSLPESPLIIGLPLVALLAGGTFIGLRRRQGRRATV